MNSNAIGIIESSSVAMGFLIGDTMIKAANTELLLLRTVCSGKFVALVGGEVAAVKSSVESGIIAAAHTLIDSFVIPNVHESVFRAIRGANDYSKPEALGILEAFSVASLIEGADAAVKAANVELIEIRLAMALGGKAFCTMTGSVSNVNEAVAAGARVIGEKGLLVNSIVIPSPKPEIFKEII